MADDIAYSGYQIVPQAVGTGWEAWVLARGVPYGRVTDHASREAVVAAAKQLIDRTLQGGGR